MGAIFSEDRKYRYTLYRDWPMADGEERQGCGHARACVMFIGLNPSTADEVNDDPTIRRCRGFAKSWGYGAMFMLNLFAFRATDPLEMMKAVDPVGQDNDHWLVEHARSATIVVAAWGRRGEYQQRDKAVLKLIGKIHQIGKAEYPRHPLYLKSNLLPIEVRP
jgi:hypothetical protein